MILAVVSTVNHATWMSLKALNTRPSFCYQRVKEGVGCVEEDVGEAQDGEVLAESRKGGVQSRSTMAMAPHCSQ